MAFSLFGKPFGYAAGGSVRAPRTANVRGQHHKLAYINNEEEALLRARGGTGEKVHGGIPAFRPVKGKNSSGQSSAGTGFSGGSNNNSSSNNNSGGGNPGDIASGGYGTGNSGGYSGGNNGGGQSDNDNDNEPNRPPVGTGGGGNSGGGNSQAEREREALARAKKAQEDKAKADKVNKDKADKAAKEAKEIAANEAKQDAKDKIAAAEKAERERFAKVKELEDQAIRDRIEADRRKAWARQVADRIAAPSNGIAGLPEGQLPANNVYAEAETIVANDSTLGGQSINDLVQKAKTMGLTVEEGEGGLVLVDLDRTRGWKAG
jgi:hypothetical protein